MYEKRFHQYQVFVIWKRGVAKLSVENIVSGEQGGSHKFIVLIKIAL